MQASLAVPETPQKNKRRSWFGLVTPTRREHHPVSVAVLPSHAEPQQQQQQQQHQPPPLGADDAVEQLNTTPVRRGPSDTLPDRPAPLWIDDAGYESDPNGTIKRRRHPPKVIAIEDSTHDDASPVRQKDLATLAILSRNNNTSKSKPFSSRIFSRSASERATPPPPDPLVAAAVASSSTPPSSFPTLSGVSAPGASKSSRRRTAIPVTDIDDVDIDSPADGGPSESPLNKPLPLVPLHDNGLPPRSASLPPGAPPLPYNMPPLPTDIVVTPSSPLARDPFADVFGPLDGDSPARSTSAPVSRQPSVVVSRSPSTRRQTSQRREQSPTPTPRPQPSVIQSANSLAALGLGLPEANGNTRRISAPPGQIPPAKVSVSSPLPMRATSAGPKVTFNAAAAADNDNDNDSGLKEPKVKAPRPRSFSAMLGRSPLLNLGDQTDDEDTPPSKFSWLSVHKTIKRRRSESKLNKRRSKMMGSGFLSQGEMTENEGESIDQGSVAHRRSKAVSPPASMTSTMGSIDRPGSTSTARMNRVAAVTPSTMTTSSTSSLSSYLLPAVSVENETSSFWTAAAQGWADSPTDDQEMMDAVESLSLRRGRGDASRASSLASTPLESLPEGGPAPTIAPIAESALEPPPTSRPPTRTGRGRSISDAARRTFVPPPLDEGPISLSSSPRSPLFGAGALAGNVDAPPPSKSPGPGPSGFRPPLSGRANSSSSAVLGKVRSVFGGRPRSNSALRYGSSDEREDGRETPQIIRPESSASAASSFIPSPALPPVRIRPEDVPQVSQLQLQINGEDDPKVVLTETPDRSPRSSYAASLGSQTPATRRSLTVDPGLQPASAMRNTRARASTISSGAISWQGTFGVGPASTASGVGLTQHSNHSTTGTFGHGAHSIHGSSVYSSSQTFLPTPSTITFPTSATPPRTRSGSIRRLSKAILVPSPLQPKPSNGSLFPLPPRSQSSGALSTFAGPSEELSSSPSLLLNGDSRGAHGDRGANGTPREQKKDKTAVSIRADDTPEAWLERLQGVSRRDLAGVLAESADKFHADALNSYMSRFDFHHIALDVALRRLLMDMSLPKETQQIDRVMEAFAVRYDACEPGLFGVKDNAYVLAFSMMMLHTDAFNQHNKSKMNKPDYVKNTRLDGVHELVLETIYDNITFTPFVFIEDDNEATLATLGVSSAASPMLGGALRSGKVDVYDMIVSGQLSTLRVNVEAQIPPESPFSCMGSSAFLDVDALQRRFADAHPLKFVKHRLRRKQSLTTFAGRPASTEPGRGPDDVQTLNITKVGLVHRKDDSIVNGKRVTGKKWKSWSVILTGSQLLFFKDTMWALTLVEQLRNGGRKLADNTVQHMSGFQPDEVLSVKDCVAVWDREQMNSTHTFSFVMPNGRQYLMQATDEYEMNDWVALVNYASTFRTAGIRMRAQAIDSGEAVMAGAAAAESHRRDLAESAEGGGGDGVGGPRFSEASNSQTRAVLFADMVTTVDRSDSSSPAPGARPLLRRVGSMRAPTPVVDVVGANSTVLAGGEQLEAVIGSVKAELAAGRGGTTRTMSMAPDADVVTKSLRTDAIDLKIKQLKAAAAPIEQRLSRNLRVARNLAILTPFQKTTRDRIEAAIPELAWQIRDDRVELSKLHLWLTMLLKDQDREQREWARVRHVALQAAAKSLRGGVGPMDRRATLAHPIEIPKLALPDQDVWSKSPNFSPAVTPLGASPVSGNTPLGTSPSPNPVSIPLPRTDGERDDNGGDRKNNMTATTVVTSPPASPQRPSADSRGSSAHYRTSSESDYELAREYLSASSELSLPDAKERALFSASPELLPTRLGDDGHDDDEAEDWQTTRAATKVSLATLPPVAADKIGELKQRIGRV